MNIASGKGTWATPRDFSGKQLRSSHSRSLGPFRVLGFRVQGLGFGVQGLGFRVYRVWGSGFGVQGLGFRLQGSGFGVQGLGFRV